MFANSTNRFGFIPAPSFRCHLPNRPNLHTLDMVAKFDRSLVEVPKTITCVARHAVNAIFSRTRTSNQLEVCTGGVGPPNPPPIRAHRSTRGSFPSKKKPSKNQFFVRVIDFGVRRFAQARAVMSLMALLTHAREIPWEIPSRLSLCGVDSSFGVVVVVATRVIMFCFV